MKLIILVSIVLNFSIRFLNVEEKPVRKHSVSADSTIHYQLKAFSVLQAKCNVCHDQRNRNAVFTLNNMNAWGGEINEQVFVKMRMPKGTTITLTYMDKETLRKWINTLK